MRKTRAYFPAQSFHSNSNSCRYNNRGRNFGRETDNNDKRRRFFLDKCSDEPISVRIAGKNIETQTRIFSSEDKINNVQIKINFIVSQISESVTINDDALSPEIETRNSQIYDSTLFGRDDQLIQTLNAGINAGQHEGGGKSLEIRRFGFNLDHGGVNGGLKILVDNVQQNQGTQGHGQGYLGALKSLSPELVQNVDIINGPFSAAYGDFSGLGVVKINLKESLPETFTARIQGGSFNTFRGFFAYSPQIKNVDAFIAYEPSYSDGPFISPLRYRRDNVTGNLTYKINEREAIGFKFNFGRNNFFSSVKFRSIWWQTASSTASVLSILKTAERFSKEHSAVTIARNLLRARRSKPTHLLGVRCSIFSRISRFS